MNGVPLKPKLKFFRKVNKMQTKFNIGDLVDTLYNEQFKITSILVNESGEILYYGSPCGYRYESELTASAEKMTVKLNTEDAYALYKVLSATSTRSWNEYVASLQRSGLPLTDTGDERDYIYSVWNSLDLFFGSRDA